MTRTAVRWQPFGQLVEMVSVRGHQLNQSLYRTSGAFPIIDQGAERISGYTDEPIAIEGPLPLIAFGDHTRSLKFVDHPFVVGADGLKLLVTSDSRIQTEYVFLLAQHAVHRLPALGYARHYSSLAETSVPVLNRVKSRDDAVDLFRRFSRAEAAHFGLITEHRRLKRALMQRHLLQAARHPRTPLGRVAHESRKRNDGALGLPAVMGVIKGQGLVPMREGMAASDLSRYLLVPPSAFAYNPMRINIGSIACSRHAFDVLVSPDYVVFTCDKSRLLPRYLDHLRYSQGWSAFVGRAGSGSVRVRIYFEHLAQFVFHLPPLAEQRAIARALDLVDDEVARLESLLAALRLQKRGVMQKLLSGEIELPGVPTAPGAPAPQAEPAP